MDAQCVTGFNSACCVAYGVTTLSLRLDFYSQHMMEIVTVKGG